MTGQNGWTEWSKFVLKELGRQGACLDVIKKDINKIRIEIATIKARASIFGALAGAVPAIIMLVVWLVNR